MYLGTVSPGQLKLKEKELSLDESFNIIAIALTHLFPGGQPRGQLVLVLSHDLWQEEPGTIEILDRQGFPVLPEQPEAGVPGVDLRLEAHQVQVKAEAGPQLLGGPDQADQVSGHPHFRSTGAATVDGWARDGWGRGAQGQAGQRLGHGLLGQHLLLGRDGGGGPDGTLLPPFLALALELAMVAHLGQQQGAPSSEGRRPRRVAIVGHGRVVESQRLVECRQADVSTLQGPKQK